MERRFSCPHCAHRINVFADARATFTIGYADHFKLFLDVADANANQLIDATTSVTDVRVERA